MNEQPLTIHQAAILMESSQPAVEKAVREQRWPSLVDDRGRELVSPDVLAQHWATDLTDPLTRPQTRDLLENLAEAADYPLDLDALEHDAARHLRIEHHLELERESEGRRSVESVERVIDVENVKREEET